MVSKINLVLSSIYGALEEELPSLGTLGVDRFERICTVGETGEVVLSWVVLGEIQGKFSLVFSGELLKENPDSEPNMEESIALLERVVTTIVESLPDLARKRGWNVEALMLPTLQDAPFMVGLDENAQCYRIHLKTVRGPLTLLAGLHDATAQAA